MKGNGVVCSESRIFMGYGCLKWVLIFITNSMEYFLLGVEYSILINFINPFVSRRDPIDDI